MLVTFSSWLSERGCHRRCYIRVVTGKSLDSPEKGNVDKMSEKCPKKCRKIVRKLSENSENTIFGYFLTIFGHLVDAFVWSDPVHCSPVAIFVVVRAWLSQALFQPSCEDALMTPTPNLRFPYFGRFLLGLVSNHCRWGRSDFSPFSTHFSPFSAHFSPFFKGQGYPFFYAFLPFF